MKLKYITTELILSVCMFVSCQNEMDENKGLGYLQLSSVHLDKSVISRTASEVMAVKITGADGTVFTEADDWTELQGKLIQVPVGGEYTVEAYSSNKILSEGIEAEPYYSGSEKVTVEPNTSHTVEVESKLAQCLVKVSYSDSFKSYFSDYSATITGNEGTSISFAKNETREAYVKSGQQLNVNLALTPNGGQSTQLIKPITENSLAAYRYNVNFDVNTDGNGNITPSEAGISGGSKKLLAFSPNAGFRMLNGSVNGELDYSDDKVEFTLNGIIISDITRNYDINVNFAPLTNRSVSLEKRIHKDDINMANGTPTTIFKIEGTDVVGEKHTYYAPIILDKSKLDDDGYYKGTLELHNLTAGTYTVSEIDTSRYTEDTVIAESNSKVSGDTLICDLVHNEWASGVFVNKGTYKQGFSHNDIVFNEFISLIQQ